MSDSILERFGIGKNSGEALVDEPEQLDDLGAFGYLRGIKDRAIMLELHHKDGRVTALAYAQLSLALFDPSEGITLHFGASVVRITGRNLSAEIRPNLRLLAGLVRHRVPWIREADRAASLTPTAASGSLLVTSIEVD